MGKKRKAGGRPFGESKSGKEDGNSKMRVTTFEDVADSEDEFHINRDKILLEEEPAAKRLRKWQEEEKFLQPSDEEVLGYSSGEDEEDEDIADASEDEEEDDLEGIRAKAGVGEDEDEEYGGWGPSKKDYYDADAIETEQDALDEEAEARRLQQKQLEAMTEADFGFDEDEWMDKKDEAKTASGDVVTEVLPQLKITDDMSEEERLKILKSRYPEFEHISKEYLRLQPLHDELASAANAAQRLVESRAAKSGKLIGVSTPIPMAVTKYRACAAYLAAMALYFTILGSTAADDAANVALDPTELHDHAVMESLLKCQTLWAKVESLPVGDPMVDASNGDELSVIEEASSAPEESLTLDARAKKAKKDKKSKAQLAAEAAQAEAQARRAEKLRKTEEELASLSTLTDKSAQRKAAKQKKTQQPMLNLLDADDSDFGEETALDPYDLAEKARKKKSLRFYTSQIAQKANKRDAAGKDYGGDADVPHRERLKDRQARLQAQAEKRGQDTANAPGVTLGEGGESSDDEDARGGPASGEDEYYDMVAARSKAKKAAKTDLAAAMAEAAQGGGRVVPVSTIGEDGKRQISYEILKNKGLHAKRNKAARNPRVKKKLKYAEKQKKLKSQKRVYSGGEGRGGYVFLYGGELTGIKKGLVRSTKL
ncbi:hypothetical protein BU24DRAFT_341440 [Aaosphaeria arxii CBS 175.79]|uniref:Sas10 C-terminal domain-containing protein n=1 Tax=Aaosphaeria arxii CBS 175.79 TaxID=1450172 RepID=A0A6A5Y1K7_9PLEO|nr:uncharacterized protein BU24DRAFT_341440 [Aaosphaeria arxii CBS 175.79]KAF2019083.1 hypothetical protein BU24DRAFT_341440 [Aaosphaeria arxii CBS 175.79]